jgi:AmiR/NasT family two-component response regulator
MGTVPYVMIVQVRGVQRTIRSLEGDVLLLHSQVDEADRVIAGQREGDKQVTLSLLILTAQVHTSSMEHVGGCGCHCLY